MRVLSVIILVLVSFSVFGQRVPNSIENIDYLMTYGRSAPTASGDDDHVQIIFFTIPFGNEKPIYIRVYDPETGGLHDDKAGSFATKTRFSIFGGNGSFTEEDARQTNPEGNFKSGNLIASKIFAAQANYDSKWYTFGPFNPVEGEVSETVNGRVLKLVVEGLTGDDGNAYRLFLSMEAGRNVAVEGANAFAYEYTFKTPENRSLSHIYPFVDKSIVSITQYNFDFDNDGEVLIYSIAKNRHVAKVSGDNQLASSKHEISDAEKNTTVDVQILKKGKEANTMSVFITNQYNQPIPFFAVPIGGPPKYKYNLSLIYKKK